MLLLFLISILLIFFAYFGYPFSLLFIRIFKKYKVKKGVTSSPVTLIITAYNEEKRIREKLENTLKLESPSDNFEILVASDGSTDQTNTIISEYAEKGIQLLSLEKREGKENAQKIAISKAKGEILVFSDVATLIKSEGLKEIAINFADPSVGCVSSEDQIIDKNGETGGEGFYVRYEMWLRRLESQANSLVGLSGSFFAVRKEVCRDFSGEMQSDFRTVLNSVKMGLRAVSDPEVIGYYQDVSDEKKEFDRKVRTVVRGITVFFGNLEFLNFLKYGLFSYQYFCHKLLRWLVPFFLITLFIVNFILAVTPSVYTILFITQVAFYIIGILGWVRKSLPTNIFVKIPVYFLTVNAAIFTAWWKYLSGQRIMMWTPSER